MNPESFSGLDRPRMARRVLVVGLTWLAAGALARCSTSLGLVPGLFALLVAGAGLRQAAGEPGWREPERRLRRLVTSAAVLLAGAMLLLTLVPLRGLLPDWGGWLLGGALLHYWLLAMGE